MNLTGTRAIAVDPTPERALLAAIVDATEQAVISVDLDGVVTSWNQGAERLYGWAPSEAVGRPLAELALGGPDIAAAIAEVAAGRDVAAVEVVRRRRDGGQVVVGETSAAVRGVDGALRGIATIARDISDRIAAEAELAELRDALAERNRNLERSNADLERFAYVASHDLSEPLRAVAGMVGLLARRYEGRLDADADEFIAFAVEGCERMRRMIGDLLECSRAGRTELRAEATDLGQLVDRAVEALRTQLVDEHGAEVVHRGLPVVACDPAQLERVLQNLIGNAVKFRRPGTCARVEVLARRSSGAGGWRIEVVDDGIGVEEAYRDRIFGMFQRLHPADEHPGSGIGLSIAERIVHQHGGEIGVTGNALGGATFWFTLPDRIEAAP